MKPAPPNLRKSGSDAPRISAKKPRGRPFAKGNPGRPNGARGKLPLLRDALRNGKARDVVALAREGNIHAAIAIAESLQGQSRKRRDPRADLSAWNAATAADAAAMMRTLTNQIARGLMTPADAARVARHIDRSIVRLRKNRVEALLRGLAAAPSGEPAPALAPPQPALPRATDAAPPGAPAARPR